MEIDSKILELKRVLSTEHLYPHLLWTNQNIEDAVSLYALNLKVSGSFFLALHILEVTLRISVNDCLTQVWGKNWFFREEILRDRIQQNRIDEVKSWFKKKAKNNQISNASLVSNLSFSFWTTLFASNHGFLWGNHLHKVFLNEQPIQRKKISILLNKLRKLRNSIAHHEVIIHLDLESLYEDCRKLIGMISPVALEWCDSLSDFYEVHPGIAIILDDRVNPELDLSPYCFSDGKF